MQRRDRVCTHVSYMLTTLDVSHDDRGWLKLMAPSKLLWVEDWHAAAGQGVHARLVHANHAGRVPCRKVAVEVLCVLEPVGRQVAEWGGRAAGRGRAHMLSMSTTREVSHDEMSWLNARALSNLQLAPAAQGARHRGRRAEPSHVASMSVTLDVSHVARLWSKTSVSPNLGRERGAAQCAHG